MEAPSCELKSLPMSRADSPLPINYNHLFAGVIYGFLAESDPEYASFLHNEGYLAAEKRFKLFTFSQLMAERRRITGDKIHFRSTLTWYVSSPIERFLSILPTHS